MPPSDRRHRQSKTYYKSRGRVDPYRHRGLKRLLNWKTLTALSVPICAGITAAWLSAGISSDAAEQTDAMSSTPQAPSIASSGPGYAPLTVGHCALLKDGKPFRGVGVNYFDALYRRQLDAKDQSSLFGMRELKAHKVPFMRFAVLPPWPNEMKRYIANPDLILADMDPLVAEAERDKIGLIPSVFFNAFFALPNALNEPISAWGDPSSRTSEFAARISRKLAARYRTSHAIWAWEFGNELNDWSNVPVAFRYYHGNVPKFGGPASYTVRDNYSSMQLNTGFKTFKNAIRAGDPYRFVETGYDIPRNKAFNLMHYLSVVDTVPQFYQAVAAEQADSDMISFHIYQYNVEDRSLQRFRDHPVSAVDFITYAAKSAAAVCKPLFIGELGPDAGDKDTGQKSLDEFQAMLDAFTASSGALAAMWVYDYPKVYNSATYDNMLAPRLLAVDKANAALRGKAGS